MIDLTTYDEFNFVNPSEFFEKTEGLILNLTRITFDNCKCNFISKITGQSFRQLLNSIKEEMDCEDEYILIFKTKNGYLLRQECYDGFEEENIINEWEIKD